MMDSRRTRLDDPDVLRIRSWAELRELLEYSIQVDGVSCQTLTFDLAIIIPARKCKVEH